MTNSFTDIIQRGIELLYQGNIEEALQIANKLEKEENLTLEEKLESQMFKAYVLSTSRDYEGALKIGTYIQKEGNRMGKPLISIRAIVLIKFIAKYLLARYSEVWEDIQSCEQLLESPLQKSSSEREEGEALVNFLKGYFSFWEGEYDLTLKYFKKCLSFFEQNTSIYYFTAIILNVTGPAYMYKGDLDKGLNDLMKSLEIINSSMGDLSMVEAGNYNWMGMIYYQQGKLDLSIEYNEKSLEIWEQIPIPNSNFFMGLGYNNLIKIFLDKQSFDKAQETLSQFSQFLERNEISKNFYWYKIAQARILKSSPRTRDRAEAENIFKTMIKGHDFLRESGTRGMTSEFTDALIELSSLYLEELYSTHDLGILNDIQPLLERLLNESRRTNSSLLLAQTNLLQGKIALLKMNMGDARQYITQAQDIAEKHGLQLLAQSISKEHDKLLETLDKFENIDKLDMAFSERLDLASFDDVIARMQGKRAITAPELVNEEPVLLLIIAEGGVPIFSYPFSEEWSREDERFASFLSAISSFSNEIFSEGLDRVKFNQYTVLMMPMGEISSCYLFKGQTYLAKQKLTRFTEGIQNNNSIMESLNKYYQTSQVVELSDFPFLEVFLKDVFGSHN